jgi:hypothetical protein
MSIKAAYFLLFVDVVNFDLPKAISEGEFIIVTERN